MNFSLTFPQTPTNLPLNNKSSILMKTGLAKIIPNCYYCLGKHLFLYFQMNLEYPNFQHKSLLTTNNLKNTALSKTFTHCFNSFQATDPIPKHITDIFISVSFLKSKMRPVVSISFNEWTIYSMIDGLSKFPINFHHIY